MGPNANDSIMQWGNYTGYPTETTTILEGIREKIGNVKYIKACGLTRNEVLESRFDEIIDNNGNQGMTATYWNNTDMSGVPAATACMPSGINLSNGGNTVFCPNVNLEHFSARFEGTYIPRHSEEVEFNLAFDDCARLVIIPVQDIIASTDRINIPGTVTEENWTYRIDCETAEFNSKYSKEMQMVKDLIKESNR
jgi:beta-glucosidase